MTERGDLLESIANTIRDYRAGETPEPTPAHVDRWISQFDADVQVPMLRELDYMFKQTYLSESRTWEILEQMVDNWPCSFWRAAHILDIQRGGRSQSEILEMFDAVLREKCGAYIDFSGADNGSYVYLDDALFTGDRIIEDMSSWMRGQSRRINNLKVYVLVIAAHTSGINSIRTILGAVNVQCAPDFLFENEQSRRNHSDVLWPVSRIQGYDMFPYRLPQQRESRIFSSESGRQLLENEFMNAGIKIVNFASNPDQMMKPLGYSRRPPGFGSMFVTFRNCPNNCPLAIWYGDPSSYPESHPLGRWYPLFPRKGHSQ